METDAKSLQDNPHAKRRKKMRSDWSQLPDDLLSLIMNRCLQNPISLEDYAAIINVCKSWRFALSNSKHPATVSAWLVGKEHNYHSLRYKSGKVRLTSTLDDTSVARNTLVEVPYTSSNFGSPTGWFFCQNYDVNHRVVQLINPITGARVTLPRLNRTVRKSFVFYKPTSDHNVHGRSIVDKLEVVAIFNFSQDIMVAGKKEWEKVRHNSKKNKKYHDHETCYNGLVDLVKYKDSIYAICKDGTILLFDYSVDGRIVGTNISFPPPKVSIDTRHSTALNLVESGGELLVVVGHMDVYWVDLNSGDWIEIDDLGEHSLFVGDNNYSMSLALGIKIYEEEEMEVEEYKYEEVEKEDFVLRGNCIFYTQRGPWNHCALVSAGSYDMRKKIHTQFYYHNEKREESKFFDLFWYKLSQP